jgi:exosortase family protein XrtF
VKKYLITYKRFLLFLGKFFLTYLLLTYLYESYLGQFNSEKFEVDSFTQVVAKQAKDVLLVFGQHVSIVLNPNESAINFVFNKKYIVRIIEGCNGLSVIILFISFIIAFSGKRKTTILYIIGGSILIHFFNVLRISFLCFLIYHFPEYQTLLHGVVFPLFIYGVVFLLWIIWVNKFSLYASKTAK